MSESQMLELRKRFWMFVVTCSFSVAMVNVASAQDLGFLNMTDGFIKAFVGHPIWGTALCAVAVWELVMLGLTKKLIHLIGMIAPCVVAAAWVNRSSLMQTLAGISI